MKEDIMKNARNQHRTDYAKELIKIVQTTKDREELSDVELEKWSNEALKQIGEMRG